VYLGLAPLQVQHHSFIFYIGASTAYYKQL
jgi:hypothetical protein